MADPASYTVGWICALPVEYIAAQEFLDEEHERPKFVSPNDSNDYTLGEISGHNVVIAVMPDGDYGTASAANTAANMLSTFQNIRIGLMVGIGGGAPSKRHDVRLGDVVVSASRGDSGGVFQYDFGKSIQDQEFQHTRFLNQPPAVLRTAMAGIRTQYERTGHLLDEAIDTILARNKRLRRKYKRPSPAADRLFRSDIVHKPTCGDGLCTDNTSHCVARHERIEDEEDNPAIHYGLIASGNQLMKDAMIRDKFAAMKEVLCFEMEAAGLMNNFPCLVIRGICDYSDSHKNDEWHGYAAMVAAGYAKDLLKRIPLNQIEAEQRIGAILSDGLKTTNELLQQSQLQVERYHHERVSKALTEEQLSCHQSFKVSNYEEQKNINPNRVQGTCQWALQSSEFTRWWRANSSDLLWISADPGCGKSVLARAITDEFIPSSRYEVVSCYFFFKDNDQQNGLATALCALLHQLFTQRPDLLEHAIPPWKNIGQKIQQEVDELWRILIKAALAGDCQVVCVLDALDECREKDQSQLIERLNQYYLQQFSSAGDSWLKFLVTSRPYDHINDRFLTITESFPNLRLKGEEENDQIQQEINLVVKFRVKELAKAASLSDHIQQRLEKQLLQMEHRTYLWLHLAIDDIKTTFKNSLRPDDESIRLIPQSVNEAYKKILCRVPSDKVAEVQKILQIIFAARRPLTIREMAMALGIATLPQCRLANEAMIDPKGLDAKLRHLCGLFVFINNSKVYLIHQTAREFLIQQVSERDLNLAYSFSPQGPEILMTDICVRYLLMEDLSSDENELGFQSRSLLEYSAENWPDHVRSTSLDSNVLLVDYLLRLYDTTASQFGIWYPIFWNKVTKPEIGEKAKNKLDRMSWKLSSIQLAALNDHFQVLQKLDPVESGESEQKSRGMIHALAWASWKGNEDICQFLLEHGANPNQHSEIRYGYPLVIATKMRHFKVVKALLEKGADPNLTCPYFCSCGHSDQTPALQFASDNGDLEIAQILLGNGANVNYFGGTYESAIHAASMRGHIELVRFLLNSGADPKSSVRGPWGTALIAASHRGHSEIVKLLMEAGADSTYNHEGYGTALITASAERRLEAVRVLLQQGADVNFQSWQYGSALTAASAIGDLEIVRLLLNNGADANVHSGRYNRNALEMAASCGHLEVLEALLEAGGNIEIGSKQHDPSLYRGTALMAACFHGQEEIMSMLLTLGANINAENEEGESALVSACDRGHDKIVQILLERGADLSIQGRPALLSACDEGHDNIVQILLERGVDLITCGEDAIDTACRGGHDKVLQVLLDRGVDLSTCGDLAIQTACREGHDKVVRQLLSRGVDLPSQETEMLHNACWAGHDKLVEILLNQEADVNAQGKIYKNALQAACRGGRKDAVVVLLDHGADMNIQGPYGNALQIACYDGDGELLETLLGRGATMDAPSGPYGNALQVACYKGNEDFVDILLDQGANVNSPSGPHGNALQIACYKRDIELVKALLHRGADVNALGGPHGSALQIACYKRDEELVGILLDRGADVNAPSGPHGNALEIACYKRDTELVKALLHRGADVNALGGPHGSALQIACYKRDEELVGILLDRGADVNAPSGPHGNALQAACYKIDEKLTKTLLDQGADVNAPSGPYGNALQAACLRGHAKLTETLLDRGADVNAQSGPYGSALDAACLKKHMSIAEILLGRGADVNLQGSHFGYSLHTLCARGYKEAAQIAFDQGLKNIAQTILDQGASQCPHPGV